jgi:hypothetical protein
VYCVALTSPTAAILAALQTFLRFSELAEKYRVAGARFAALKQEIELIASMSPIKKDDLEEKLKDLEGRWDKTA